MNTVQQVCAAALTVAGTAVVMEAWARASLRPPVVDGERLLLRYPAIARWFAWCGVLFMFVVLCGLAWPFVVGTPGPFGGRSLALGATMFITFVVIAWREFGLCYQVDGEGIGGRTPFRGHRRVAWRDLVEVRWHRPFQYFVLVDGTGQRLRVPRFLRGHAVVPMMLRAHVPEHRWRDAVAAWRRDIDREPDDWSVRLLGPAPQNVQNRPDTCTTTALPPRSSERTTSKP